MDPKRLQNRLLGPDQDRTLLTDVDDLLALYADEVEYWHNFHEEMDGRISKQEIRHAIESQLPLMDQIMKEYKYTNRNFLVSDSSIVITFTLTGTLLNGQEVEFSSASIGFRDQDGLIYKQQIYSDPAQERPILDYLQMSDNA